VGVEGRAISIVRGRKPSIAGSGFLQNAFSTTSSGLQTNGCVLVLAKLARSAD